MRHDDMPGNSQHDDAARQLLAILGTYFPLKDPSALPVADFAPVPCAPLTMTAAMTALQVLLRGALRKESAIAMRSWKDGQDVFFGLKISGGKTNDEQIEEFKNHVHDASHGK